MTNGNVLSLFSDPRESDCRRAIALAMLRVRASGRTCEQIAEDIGCNEKTVENASNERTMLKFAQIAKLIAKYPDVAPLIEGLWNAAPHAPPSVDARIERIESELDAIRRHACNRQ